VKQSRAEQRKLLRIVVQDTVWQGGELRMSFQQPFEQLQLSNCANSRRERPFIPVGQILIDGGGRGIRTPVRVTPQTVFKTAGFNHSPIPPPQSYLISSVYTDGTPTNGLPEDLANTLA
jgi:hypothetical protein